MRRSVGYPCLRDFASLFLFFLVARRVALCACVCVYRLEWTRKTGERKKQTSRSAPRKSSSSLRFDAVPTGSSRPQRGRRSVSRGTCTFARASCSANGTVARIFAAAKVKTRACMGNTRRCGAHATGQALSYSCDCALCPVYNLCFFERERERDQFVNNLFVCK